MKIHEFDLDLLFEKLEFYFGAKVGRWNMNLQGQCFELSFLSSRDFVNFRELLQINNREEGIVFGTLSLEAAEKIYLI